MTPEEVHRVANERLMQMSRRYCLRQTRWGQSYPNRQRDRSADSAATGDRKCSNCACWPAAPTQPAANRSPQRATPPQVVLNRLRVRREGNSGELS